MFSGIVEEAGKVVSFDGERLVVSATKTLDGLNVADSILVAGVCLTVVELTDNGFVVETVPETLQRSNFGDLNSGDGVNLERALEYGARIGGHMVQGHVDAVGTVDGVTPDGNSIRVGVRAPVNIMRYVVEKGFIAIDGTSLTVVDCDEQRFSVAIIPYTRENTTIGGRQPGDRVNLEADVTAKYVERLAAPYLGGTLREGGE